MTTSDHTPHCWHERDHQSTEYLVIYWVCCECDEATRWDPTKEAK